MRFSPMAALACLLCVGIMYLGMNSPQQSRLDADEITQKKDSIAAIEHVVEALKNQTTINNKLTEADNRTIETLTSLQESIARLGEHVKDSVPTREEVTKLVSAKIDTATTDDDATCLQKVEQLEKQLSELKARVEVLELTRATATKAPTSTTPTASAAAATSSYGMITSMVPTASGGSTGSVKSGGSTGMVRSSYGSNGTATTGTTRVVESTYAPRWKNHDGLSRAEHAAVYHGLNTAGMTQAQINAQLDADHDRHGPMHDGILASRTRSVTRSTYSPPATATSNCPGGVCPTGPSASTRGGLLGFGILGRR